MRNKSIRSSLDRRVYMISPALPPYHIVWVWQSFPKYAQEWQCGGYHKTLLVQNPTTNCLKTMETSLNLIRLYPFFSIATAKGYGVRLVDSLALTPQKDSSTNQRVTHQTQTHHTPMKVERLTPPS